MSEVDDFDFIEKVVQTSEKFVCGQIAKLQKQLNGLRESNKQLEGRVSALETENGTLRQELQTYKDNDSQNHQKCLNAMGNAFAAAFNTVILPGANLFVSGLDPSPGSGVPAEYMTFGVPPTSTPKNKLPDPDNEELTAKKLRLQTKEGTEQQNSTTQIYTDVVSLPPELLAKLGPYLKENKCATRDMLTLVQRAFIKYKVNEMMTTNQKVSEAFVNGMIHEGVTERIWIEDFRPSKDCTLEKYIKTRLKNELKAVNKEKLLASTSQRVANLLCEASLTEDELSIAGDCEN